MASHNNGGKTPNHYHHCGGAAHHHHHFFYISPHCPLHRPISQPKNHSPSCSYQNPNALASIPLDPQLSHLTTHPDQIFNNDRMVEDEMEKVEQEEEENEEEGDPIFVLTDEWREFFAKSEAKRRLAKKEAKKGKK